MKHLKYFLYGVFGILIILFVCILFVSIPYLLGAVVALLIEQSLDEIGTFLFGAEIIVVFYAIGYVIKQIYFFGKDYCKIRE